jgi:hypothetical protein
MQEGQDPRPARREALRRVGRVKRWVVGGAVTLTGVFSAVAAHALPASHAKAQPATPVTGPANDDQGSAASQPASPSLSPPAQAPQATPSQPSTVSGGS